MGALSGRDARQFWNRSVPARVVVPDLPLVTGRSCRNASNSAATVVPMTADVNLHGLWVPLVTPFDASDRVDLEAMQRLCHDSLRAGARGLVALATTGENTALDAAEKRA